MDGNNRWSKKNKKSLFESYSAGANSLIKISNHIFKNYNINYVSAFALSKNNLKRSSRLISTLKDVLSYFLDQKLKNQDLNFRIKFMGDISFLNKKVQSKINSIQNLNYNKKQTLMIFINYSGQEDILNSINYSSKYNKKINIQLFNKNLITAGMPDPDLLVRTGGFQRISDFMLFQLSFTELLFTKKLWPDLNSSDVDAIIKKYFNIDRKFGI